MEKKKREKLRDPEHQPLRVEANKKKEKKRKKGGQQEKKCKKKDSNTQKLEPKKKIQISGAPKLRGVGSTNKKQKSGGGKKKKKKKKKLSRKNNQKHKKEKGDYQPENLRSLQELTSKNN